MPRPIAPTPELTFDPETHIYKWGGKVVPSVTGIISPLSDFSRVNADVLESARAYGTYVHEATELADNGDLDWDALWPPAAGAVTAWQRFVAETGFTALAGGVEARLYHPVYRYAGTADRIGWLNEQIAVIDIKTGATLSPSWGVQTAAYAEAWNANVANETGKSRLRMSVQLRDDGSYHAETYRSAEDWSVFLACLTLHNWRNKHGH